MRILVLGGNGMAGHVIRSYLETNLSNEVYYTVREKSDCPSSITLELTDEPSTYKCFKKVKPDIVINAVGILNEHADSKIKEAIYINSLLPHKLADYGKELGYRLIHISTDCVFSGSNGGYTEIDEKDGDSMYSITKSLGEVIDLNHVTIRTSIIGPELRNYGIGLFHWFMKQSGEIKGFQNVLWNGVTTLELAKAIEWIMQRDLSGLVHLRGTKRLSKYELLLLFKDVFNREDIKIIPCHYKKADKTLVNTRRDFSYPVPEYRTMLFEMKEWMENNKELYSSYFFN